MSCEKKPSHRMRASHWYKNLRWCYTPLPISHFIIYDSDDHPIDYVDHPTPDIVS